MPFKNDYELLFLAKYEQSEVALDCLFSKYDNLIYKIIHQLSVSYNLVEDYHQEGLMMLLKAVDTFDETQGKTFTKYFELILTRHIIYLKKHEKKYTLFEDFYGLESFTPPSFLDEKEEVIIKLKTPIEELIYQDRFKSGLTIDQICQKNNMAPKKVYNTIYRINQRCKNS